MAHDDQTLNTFVTRARQLLLSYRQLRKENEELYAMLDKSEHETEELRKQLEEKSRDYEALKTARMLAVSGDDIEASKERLAKLIRDVNKCITVLADQKAE